MVKRKQEKIVLIGGGGHGKVVIDAVKSAGRYMIEGIIDTNLKPGSKVLGVTVLGGDDILSSIYKKGIKNAFISVGSIGDCAVRCKIYKKIKKIGFNLPVIVHPSAVIALDVELAAGTFIGASVTVNTGTKTGKNAIINTSASIDHDCKIGNFVHIAPGCVFSGSVRVGDYSHIGAKSVVNQNIIIGAGCIIGSGSVVTRNIPDNVKAFGSPCQPKAPKIAGKKIFIIAEAGVNHNGSLDIAKKMVDVASAAGADAVKFQVFQAKSLASRNAEKADYQKRNMPDSTENQFEMLKKLELSAQDFKNLKTYCDEKKILFLATPYDNKSADFLENIVPIFKISSGDLTNLPFIEYVAKKNKPIILSTGMATMEEIKQAVAVIGENQNCGPKTAYAPLTLLHCTTNYPCPYEEVNLNAIASLKEATGLPLGYSDHTLGIEISLASAAIGTEVIEKHFTLDKNMAGPDHSASIEPEELRVLVKSVRNIEKSFGSSEKKPTASELNIMKVARKSLVVVRDVKKGEIIKEDMFVIKRPGYGIQPSDAQRVINKQLVRDKKQDENLFWEDLK